MLYSGDEGGWGAYTMHQYVLYAVAVCSDAENKKYDASWNNGVCRRFFCLLLFVECVCVELRR